MAISECDLIRRSDAIALIHAEMKKTIMPVRKGGLKYSLDLLRKLPEVKTDQIPHSHWFINANWYFCDNCGGRADGCRTTPFCPHCGARMDAMTDIE